MYASLVAPPYCIPLMITYMTFQLVECGLEAHIGVNEERLQLRRVKVGDAK